MRRLRAAASAVALFAALAAAAPAAAEDVSRSELKLLLSAAPTDPAAEARLEGVTSVEGRPADLDRVLGDDPGQRDARLAELGRAVGASDAGVDGASLSERARELAGDGPPPPPERSDGGGGGSFAPLGVSTPVAIGLAVLTILVAALLAQRAGRRRLPPSWEEGAPAGEDGDEGEVSPRRLEQLAERAARDGDHATAVRLRFRAGLQRLAGVQAIELRPSLTAGQVARSVPSSRLRGLTSTFERVVYGGVPATEEDSSTARRDWPLAVREASGGR